MLKLTHDEEQQLKKMIEQNRVTLVRLRKAAQQNHDEGNASCFPEEEVAEALTATMHAALCFGADIAVARARKRTAA